jgi:hypothetical protein
VIAAHEVDFGARSAHGIERLQDLLVAAQAEVGVVEPEVEDVAEQDKVAGAAGPVAQFKEPLQAPGFGHAGAQVEMRVGHEDDRGLRRVRHGAHCGRRRGRRQPETLRH